jgi:DNA-binding transcriptional ArsR family regulator
MHRRAVVEQALAWLLAKGLLREIRRAGVPPYYRLNPQHRSVPEIHHELERRRIAIAPRTVLHVLERYDELVALSLTDPLRLQGLTKTHGRVILALDGLQPDVGHEVRPARLPLLTSAPGPQYAVGHSG